MNKIPELEKELARLGKDQSKKRIDALNKLAWEIGFNDIKKAYQYSSEAYELSLAHNYDSGKAKGLLMATYYLYSQSDFEAAINKGKQAFELFKELNDKEGQAHILTGFGMIQWGLGDYEKALKYMLDGLKIYEKIDSLEYQSWTLTSLGGVYHEIGDPDQALYYHFKSLDVFEQINNELGKGRALSGISTVYFSLGEYESALENHFKCLQIFLDQGHKLSIARAMNDIGNVQMAIGKLDEALNYYEGSLKIRQELETKTAETTSLINLGKLYNQKKEGQKALAYLKKSLTISTKLGLKPKLYQTHQAMSEAYYLIRNYERSLIHQKEFQKVKEEVFNEEIDTKLKNLQIGFEIEKSEKEAEIQRLRNVELADTLEKLKLAQVRLVQSGKMAALANLISGIVHEVNAPISEATKNMEQIIHSVQRIKDGLAETERENGNGSLLEEIDRIHSYNQQSVEAAQRIKQLIKNLKNFAKLDEAKLQSVDIHDCIESSLAVITPQLPGTIEVQKKYGSIPKINAYVQELNQVFITLLANAVEAIEKKGTIKIKTNSSDNTIHIKISDTGRGIPKNKLNKIFDIGLSEKETGMRMQVNLANSYRIIQKHKGQMTVKSKPGKETSFEIRLPIN